LMAQYAAELKQVRHILMVRSTSTQSLTCCVRRNLFPSPKRTKAISKPGLLFHMIFFDAL